MSNHNEWKRRLRALLSRCLPHKSSLQVPNLYHCLSEKTKKPTCCLAKACKALFQRSASYRNRNGCHRCHDRHHGQDTYVSTPLSPPLVPTAPATNHSGSESRTLAMAKSVRLAGRVVDSIQEQRRLMHKQSSIKSPADPQYDALSDASSLPPVVRSQYRLLNGPEIENIEAYVAGWQLDDTTSEYDNKVTATTGLSRSTTLASRRRQRRQQQRQQQEENGEEGHRRSRSSIDRASLRCIPPITGIILPKPNSPTLIVSPILSPLMVTRCKTSRGIFSDFPTGQPSPTTSPRSSIFSMGLKSPTFSQKRISAKVAPKTRRSCTNLTKASRLSLSPSEIRTLNLKEEYNSDKDEERRKKEEASFATTINDQRCSKGALRRSRSKLQRLDHGELTTEIRSPNGLANTPKTRTFNDWKKALMSAGADADTDVDVEVYAGCIGIGGDSKSESEVRKMKRASDPQGIIPPQGGQHHQRLRHPIEIRLEQRELMVRQLKTFVKDRMALEDQFWEADKVLRKYEAENEDYEAKYQELCKELALVKNSLKNGDMYQVT